MLMMHYRIALGGDPAQAATAIRKRVAERGALFDGMAGLERKFFLLDPSIRPTPRCISGASPRPHLPFCRGHCSPR
jgi:hypothetical protein